MKFFKLKGHSSYHNMHKCLLPHSFQFIIHSLLPILTLVLKCPAVLALASALLMTIYKTKKGFVVLMVISGIGHHV